MGTSWGQWRGPRTAPAGTGDQLEWPEAHVFAFLLSLSEASAAGLPSFPPPRPPLYLGSGSWCCLNVLSSCPTLTAQLTVPTPQGDPSSSSAASLTGFSLRYTAPTPFQNLPHVPPSPASTFPLFTSPTTFLPLSVLTLAQADQWGLLLWLWPGVTSG